MRFADVLQFPSSPATNSAEHASAMARRDAALDEQERAAADYEQSIGTRNELPADNALAGAREQVAAREAWVEWIERDY